MTEHETEKREAEIERAIMANADKDGAWATAYALLRVCQAVAGVEQAIDDARSGIMEKIDEATGSAKIG